MKKPRLDQSLRKVGFLQMIRVGKALTMLSLIALDKYPRGFPFLIPTNAAIAKKVVVSGDKRKIEDINLDKEGEG